MDHAPLNLAHFHERRADKFIRMNRFDDANEAIETSLIYLQDAYKKLTLPKSIEVLNTQKWDYERKLRQIQIRKEQYERLKLQEIVPARHSESGSTASSVVMLRPEASVTPQSVAKAIDKTIEDFDAKFSMTGQLQQLQLDQTGDTKSPKQLATEPDSKPRRDSRGGSLSLGDEEFLPVLAPLDLPTFDVNAFNGSAISLNSIASLAESFQK